MDEGLRETATDRNANNWTSSRKEPEVVVCQLRSLVTGRHPSDFRARTNLFAFQELYTPVNHPVGQKRLSDPITEKEIAQAGHMAGISQDSKQKLFHAKHMFLPFHPEFHTSATISS